MVTSNPVFPFQICCLQNCKKKFRMESLASFPGLPCFQFLIACSMQKWRKKTWVFLPHDLQHRWRHRFWTQRDTHTYVFTYRETRQAPAERQVLPLKQSYPCLKHNWWRMVAMQVLQIRKQLLFFFTLAKFVTADISHRSCSYLCFLNEEKVNQLQLRK